MKFNKRKFNKTFIWRRPAQAEGHLTAKQLGRKDLKIFLDIQNKQELAVCPFRKAGQQCPGLHQEQGYSQVEEVDASPLLCTGEDAPRVLCPLNRIIECSGLQGTSRVSQCSKDTDKLERIKLRFTDDKGTRTSHHKDKLNGLPKVLTSNVNWY